MPSNRSKLSLYELSIEGMQIQDLVMLSEGEITPETEERLWQLLVAGAERIESAAMVVRGLEGAAAVCEQEVERLAQRATGFNNAAKRLKDKIAMALDCAFSGKIKTQRFTVWTQKAPDTVGFDLKEGVALEALPEQFVRVKRELDKTALKDALKRGDALPAEIFVDQRIGQRYTRIA